MERYALGTALAAAIIGLLALGVAGLRQPPKPPAAAVSAADLARLEKRLQELEQLVGELRAAAPKTGELESRLAALEHRPSATPAPASPAPSRALTEQLTRVAEETAGLRSRLEELAQRQRGQQAVLEQLAQDLGDLRQILARGAYPAATGASPAPTAPASPTASRTAGWGETGSPESQVEVLGLRGQTRERALGILREAGRRRSQLVKERRDNLSEGPETRALLQQLEFETQQKLNEILTAEEFKRYLELRERLVRSYEGAEGG